MKDLRNLLLDCRAALRRADPQFENSPLRARMDENIIGMSKAEDTPKEVAAPQTFSAQQVAYAWQQAARELHFTHPELYAELGREVRERLHADTFVDPNTELVRVQMQLKQAQAERDSAQDAVAAELAAAHGGLQASHVALQDELAGLRHALSSAVALDGTDAHGSDAELALRRIRVLVEAAQRGGGLPKARAEATGDIAPTADELQQVSRGVRAFSDEQREWCVGEAVVRSHFALSPVQLLADGDPALATLLLQASHLSA